MKPGTAEGKVKVGAEVEKNQSPVISFISGGRTETTVDMTPIVPKEVNVPDNSMLHINI